MTPTIIICGTIFILFSLLLYITNGLVMTYLNMKIDNHKDMEVLYSDFSKLSEELVAIQNNLNSIQDNVKVNVELLSQLPDLTTIQKDMDDIKGKVASNQIGQVFSPRRKGK